ncbi:MAG: glycine--tRNA ligase subunit beta [Sphingorhabdus sp.]
MTDFLLELRSEEIPARMQAKARADLEKAFAAQLADAGLNAASINVYSTPRRLALIGRGLSQETEAVSEEAKGPPEGAPDQAVDGFCRKQGVTREQLEVRVVKGRPTYFAVINRPGRATSDVLAEAIPAIIRGFLWPKSMRWGDASVTTESLRWVRPLSGIVALFGDDVVPCEVGGIVSGNTTLGHRFHSDGEIVIGNADNYADKLRTAHVIVDHEERQNIIRDGAAKAASDAGLSLIEDEGLVIENAGLTEWPVPLLGRFDEAFLDVPEEVIQLTARVNQKYFVCKSPPARGGGSGAATDGGGSPSDAVSDEVPLHHPADGPPPRAGEDKLANAFVCTANIDATDGGKAIVAGNEKVLAARLSDAKFFWELDQKTKLRDHAKKLENIVFHEKLGTVADKVERVAKLARWLCEEGIIKPSPPVGEGGAPSGAEGEGLSKDSSAAVDAVGPHDSLNGPHPNPSPQGGGASLADLARQAACLCKADLVTEMVGEFPELQGLMGGYYAAKEGLPAEVAAAIRDHYKPVGQGDDVPTDPVTVAVSLADKLDTLVGFFAIDEKPTGSKDPFALRRASIGIIRLLVENRLNTCMGDLLWAASSVYLAQAAEHGRLYHRPDSEVDFVDATNWPNSEEEQMLGDWFILHDRSVDPFDRDAPVIDELDSADSRLTDWSGYLEIEENWLSFFADRLKVQQREAGVRHDLIDAVFALGGEDDLVRLLARVKALQAFVETPDGTNLLAGYKRAANILKQNPSPLVGEGGAPSGAEGEGLARDSSAADAADPSPNPLPQGERAIEETALLNALDTAEPKAAAAIKAEDFAAAMTALASLRAPIDDFFENVMVNDEDEAKRAFRLGLLTRFRDAVHTVADFSKIEG